MLENLPVLLLKKLVLLPYQEVRLELNIELSKEIIDIAYNNFDKKLLVICPNNTLEQNPTESDLPDIGVIAKIKSKLELPNGNYRAVIRGINRVKIKNYKNFEDNPDMLEAKVKKIYIDNGNKAEELAIVRTLKSVIEEYMLTNSQASNSVINTIANVEDLDMLTDIVTNYMPFDLNKKVYYMNEFDYIARANSLIKDISLELQVINIESKIDDEIRESFEKEQREFILKQKISKLNEELGLNVDKQTEVSLYEEKIESLQIDEKIKSKFRNEIKKYSYTSETNPDSSVIRNYLETVINLPWNKSSEDEKDIKKIKKILDKSHYGLTETKQRIIEYIAIKKNNENINAPIICLVGPPGTGKTTLGMSISKALNREFYKISVGGLNDPSELIGHRKTYLGASPGKIIQGIKKCGTNNPVILIDEVDKIVSDYKGDPTAVLLDILDPAQNYLFTDNYIEEPFNLSKVLFVLTANDINKIPAALRDRLEIIEISSYTEMEKVDIIKKYIVPLIIEEYNTKKVKISDETIMNIINGYTKESGIRELTRLFKKLYRNILIKDKSIKQIDDKFVREVLGPIKYNTSYKMPAHTGSVNTLGVTPHGGIIISIESILMPGTGKTIITGNVEPSIEESIQIASGYIKANYKKYKIKLDEFNSHDIHINALNYSVKKQGTSGGLAFTTSLLSLYLNKIIPDDTAFTGELTLHGDICKVGGIKEKIIGAYNNDFKKVFIPKENEYDLELVPEDVKNNMEIICVSSFEEVYNNLF